MSEPTFTAEQLRAKAAWYRRPPLSALIDMDAAAMLEFAARLVERQQFLADWISHHIGYAKNIQSLIERQVIAFQSVLDDDLSRDNSSPEEPR